MCIICEKYGISKASYEQMVRNGVISTTFPAHEDIFIYYRECLKTMSAREAILKTSIDKRVSERTVYYTIKQF